MGRVIRLVVLLPLLMFAFALGTAQAAWLMLRERKKAKVQRQEVFNEENAEVVELRGGELVFRSRTPREQISLASANLGRVNGAVFSVTPPLHKLLPRSEWRPKSE